MDIRSGLVLFCIFVQCRASCQLGTKLEKYNLIDKLLDDSNCKPKLPPNYNKDEPMNVSVQVSIYDMNGLRDETMEYECTLYIRLSWVDERLEYSQFGSYEYLTLTGEDIQRYWIPDLYFHHEEEASFHEVFRTNEVVYIGQNGSVTYSARLTILSHCQLDLFYYPFDKQNCDITIHSYSLKADNLLLEWAKKSPFKVQGTEYISITDNSTTSSFSSPYSDPIGNYSTLHANLKFERVHKHYEVMYIAPPISFVLVAFSSVLLIDFDDFTLQLNSRLATSTGMLISTVMLWAGIYAKLPPVAILTYLDTWMLVNVIVIATINAFHLLLFRCGIKISKLVIICLVVVYVLAYICFTIGFTFLWKRN